MSSFTSLAISREKARAALLEHLLSFSDSQLEDMVNTLTRPALYRVHIDGDTDGRDDDQLRHALP